MKTLLDKTTRDELIKRINSLKENNQRQWGTMNVYQMTKHCCGFDELVLNNKKTKRGFISYLLGKFILKSVIKDEAPMRRGTPTLQDLIITENGDVNVQKAKWIALIEKYSEYSHPVFVHPFFGKMTKEEVGLLAYKHSDHHLRQFNS